MVVVVVYVNNLIFNIFNFLFCFHKFSEQSALTIVRRSNSKKILSQIDDTCLSPQQEQSYQIESGETTFKNYNLNTGDIENMQASTTIQQSQVCKDDNSSSSDAMLNIDLATENLPAVDTPDACDKAALRYILYDDIHSDNFFGIKILILLIK